MIDEKRLIDELNEWSNLDEEMNELVLLCIDTFKRMINKQPKVGEWIPIEERLPEEYKYIDEETGYYLRSDNVLCCCLDDYNDFEHWIDYTIDGEWQTHEYFDGEKFYWQQLPALPEPYKGEAE